MTVAELTLAQADQLLALLEAGARNEASARFGDELSYFSADVAMVLKRQGLAASYSGPRFTWWFLTSAGEILARDVLRERTHG